MSLLLADTCRLCLHTRGMIDILSMRGDASLSVKAMLCLGIKVQKSDILPTLICEMCEQNLNSFFEFRLKCHEIQRQLNLIERQHSTCCELKRKCPNAQLDDWKLDIKPDLDGIILNDLNQLPSNSELVLDCKIKQETGANDFEESLHHSLCEGMGLVSKNNYFAQPSKIEHLSECNSSNYDTVDAKDKVKNKDFIERVDETMKSHKGRTIERAAPSVQCELCGKIFKHKAILKKHLRTHSGVKLFACKVCSKQFTRAEHERVHMRAHRGQRPYVCDICARAFTKRQDLLRHMRIHSDEKNYPCPRCERRFKRAGDVSSHLRSHTGARPFSCGACDAAYSSHSGLKKHLRTHCIGAKARKTAADSDATG